MAWVQYPAFAAAVILLRKVTNGVTPCLIISGPVRVVAFQQSFGVRFRATID
ncbi:hypothetical protein [Deinococcus rubellus]|uniref:Uncharacterized protein n=1 Tax=Deinococcus rubellus TaxID=1889240 RepID=A0ABY5YHA8_9DEIO|nr:hypothetical protein [Deinococcus rubellus]UWX63188.1 hypothetical protein N0D28_10535 [Deinococcus rubellus]